MKSLFSRMFSISGEESRSLGFWVAPVGMPPHFLNRFQISALYAAVAEVLAYVYQLVNWRKAGGNYPIPPREIPVPAEMAVEAVNG